MFERAFRELFPNRRMPTYEIKYSGHFKGYNANVTFHNFKNHVIFKMSKDWKDVSDEIKIGLIQSLLVKLFKTKATTHNIDFYNNFLKAVTKYSEVVDIDPLLEESFDRMNEEYFDGFLDKPNLVWGVESKRQLGVFVYGTNTIRISTVLKDAGEWLLDYVMYHEMLHKKHLFVQKGNRSFHHTPEFKRDEKKYKNFNLVDKALNEYLRKKKKRNFLGFQF